MIEFKMPALGADMDEGTLNEWLVKPGDVGQLEEAIMKLAEDSEQRVCFKPSGVQMPAI